MLYVADDVTGLREIVPPCLEHMYQTQEGNNKQVPLKYAYDQKGNLAHAANPAAPGQQT